MPTIAEQLTQLESDRQDLVSNLQTKGITGLTGDETFTALVPEVLNIQTTATLQSKTINPSTSQQTITPDVGYNGLSQVTIDAVTSSIDANIQAGNIKKDVVILGVTGTFEGGGGGSSDLDKLIDGSITSITSSVLGIRQYACYNCISLTSASFPNATSVGNYAFQYCNHLTTISLPNASGTLNSYAFQSCSALTSINLPLVTSTGSRVFEYCTSLTTVSLSSVITLGSYTFQGCSRLTSIDIPNATRINQQCFQNCTSLVSIDLPKVTNIQSFAFYGCTNLTSVTLREEQVCTLSSADAFQNIANKVTIYVPSSLVETYKVSTGWTVLYNNNLVDFVAIS